MHIAESAKQPVTAKYKHQIRRQQGISSAKIIVYIAIFVAFVGVIGVGYEPTQTSAAKDNTSVSAYFDANSNKNTPSVDDIVATDVAANIAERADLPIASNIANTSISLNTQKELAQLDDGTTKKPHLVTATTNQIEYYKTKPGDSVVNIARKYGRSEDTIRWANGLQSDAIKPGTKLKILPVDGVIYTVKPGDSTNKIADLYNVSEQRIIAVNDLELKKPKAGQKLIIPSGAPPVRQDTVSNTVQQPSYNYVSRNGTGFGGKTWHIKTGTPMYPGNSYYFGNCTAYAYDRRHELGLPVGRWGHAASWAYNASQQGLRVDGTPSVGAIIQNGGGYGHVGVVERVLSNGDISISEMNAYVSGGGFNQVNGRIIPKSSVGQYTYIH